MRVWGWFLGGIAAGFVVLALAVLAINGRGGDGAPVAVSSVADAPAKALPPVKDSGPMVFDKYAGKPRNDAVDSGTIYEARARRAQAREVAASLKASSARATAAPSPAPMLATAAASPAPASAVAPVSWSAPKARAASKSSSKKRPSAARRKIRPSFKRGVLRTSDITIRITRYAVIPAGQDGNQYGDKPVIAFWYRTTNVSGRKTSASSAFAFAFRAYQDTDPDTENELDGSLTFDRSPESVESIKKGRTVSNVEAFELDDLTTPVHLVGREDFDPIGKTIYRLR